MQCECSIFETVDQQVLRYIFVDAMRVAFEIAFPPYYLG